MSRLFVFADEAGNFNFSRREGASKYFIVCTIACDTCEQLGSGLLALPKSGFPHKVMSALPPKADMCGALAYVCFGPIAD